MHKFYEYYIEFYGVKYDHTGTEDGYAWIFPDKYIFSSKDDVKEIAREVYWMVKEKNKVHRLRQILATHCVIPSQFIALKLLRRNK